MRQRRGWQAPCHWAPLPGGLPGPPLPWGQGGEDQEVPVYAGAVPEHPQGHPRGAEGPLEEPAGRPGGQ